MSWGSPLSSAACVVFGASEFIHMPARDGYAGKTNRLPRRRSSIRAAPGLKWATDSDRSRQWAEKCAFAEASNSAIRSAADLRVEI